MSGTRGVKTAAGIILVVAMTFGLFPSAQTARADGARDKLIGAWHLIRIESPGPDGKPQAGRQPEGMLIYTRDGHMSVQLMYPEAQHDLNNEYVRNGFESSYGTYDIDDATHTLTHHVTGANTGSLLVGKDLPRIYQFTKDGHLVIRPARSDEHWSVEWEHY